MGNRKAQILIVEDDREMAQFILRLLKRQGYDSYAVYNVAGAMGFAENNRPDLYILDIELPDGDGLSLCKELRKGSDAAVLFLTCRTGTHDKVVGLSAGGDYYLTKPYDKDELLAIVQSLLRRLEQSREKIASASVIEKGPLTLNILNGSVSLNGAEIDLTPKEFAVLLLLVQNEDRTLSNEEIYRQVWKSDIYIETGVVRKLISQIKKKLGADDTDDFAILTKYGGGYTFTRE